MSLKKSILEALENNREAALSGQLLAERLGVSRNAVWKTVNALREDGYTIDSTPNRGYQLSPLCDRLSEGALRAQLTDPNMPVYLSDSLDSTNSEARRLLANGVKEPFLVLSEAQTAGRGRHGRVFFSPQDAGLYLTVALSPGQPVESALGITACAAVCVADAVERLTGKSARIKWVNDIFLDGRKICGILTEAVTDFESGTVESLLVGIGINLRPTKVPAEWRDVIGFLDVDFPIKNSLAAAITNALLRYDPTYADYLPAYRARSMTIGQRVACTAGDSRFTGVAVAIDADGALVVQTDSGSIHALRSGEARILNNADQINIPMV